MANEKGFIDIPWDVVRNNILPRIPKKDWGNIAVLNKQLGGKFSQYQNNCKAWFKRDFPEHFSALENNTQNWIQAYYDAEQKSYPGLTSLQVEFIKNIKKNQFDDVYSTIEELKSEDPKKTLEFLERIDPVEKMNILQWVAVHGAADKRQRILSLIYNALVYKQTESNKEMGLKLAVFAHRPFSTVQKFYDPSVHSTTTLFALACEAGHLVLMNELLKLPNNLKPNIQIIHLRGLCRIMDNPELIDNLFSKNLVSDASKENMRNLIKEACLYGRVNTVKALLKHVELNPEERRTFFKSSLNAACASGNAELVQLLLDNGARIVDPAPFLAAMSFPTILRLLNPDDSLIKANMGSLLIHACDTSTSEVVEIFLDKKWPVDSVHPKLGSALEIACNRESKALVNALLNAGANPTLYREISPLHSVCQKGNLELTQLLLDHQPEQQLRLVINGQTPLDTACTVSKNIELVKLLLDKGANPNFCVPKIDLSQRHLTFMAPEFEGPIICDVLRKIAETQRDNRDIRSLSEIRDLLLTHPGKIRLDLNVALREECRRPSGIYIGENLSDSAAVVKFLLNHGANGNIPGEKSLIQLTCEGGNAAVFGALLDHDIKLTKSDIETILATTPDFIQLMIEKNKAQNINPHQLLRTAVEQFIKAKGNDGRLLIHALLQAGIDPAVPDKQGVSPFRWLCANATKSEWVEYFLKNVKDPQSLVNTSNNEGRTPLFRACENGNTAVVSALLAFDANPNHTDKKGITLMAHTESALKKAKSENNASMVRHIEKIMALLIKKGAKLSVAAETEVTAFANESAQRHEHEQTCQSIFSNIQDKNILRLLETKFSAVSGDPSLQAKDIKAAVDLLNKKVPFEDFKKFMGSRPSQALNFLFSELMSSDVYEKTVKPIPVQPMQKVEPRTASSEKLIKIPHNFLRKG